MALDNRSFPSKMTANPNRFSESEPLLRTRRYQIEKEGYDTNKKICGFRVEGSEGARAWWVAFAAFFISFIMVGTGRVYGILLPHLLRIYGINRKMASLPYSLQLALRNLLGPFVGILGHKFEVRTITFIGVVISAASTALCCWTNHYIWVIVYWGVINGIGIALCTNLLQLTIGQYFVKNKATAMGMSLAGGCIGSIALPPIIEIFLQLLDFKFIFLCLGGITALAVPFSIAFKEPSWLNAQNQSSKNYEYMKTSRAIVSLDNSLDMNQIKGSSKQVDSGNIDTTEAVSIYIPNITFLRKHEELLIKLLRRATILELKTNEKDKLHLETSIRISMEDSFQYFDEFLRNFIGEVITSNEYQNQYLKPIPASNETYLSVDNRTTTSIIDAPEDSNKSTRSSIIKKLEKISRMTLSEILALSPNGNKHDILKITRELTSLYNAAARLEKLEKGHLFPDGPVQDVQTQNDESSKFILKSIWKHFFTTCKPAFLLYRNPLFLFISICRLTHFMTFIPVLVVICDFLMEKGLPELDGQYGVISLSVGDLIGRMFTGWVTDKGYLNLPNFMAIIMFLQCAICVTLPFIHNRIIIFVTLSIFALIQGANFVRHPVLISIYMDKHEQPFAMGCLSFFAGIFSCLMPFYVGLFKDIIGNYDIMFYTSGSMGAVVGFIWCLMPKCGAFL